MSEQPRGPGPAGRVTAWAPQVLRDGHRRDPERARGDARTFPPEVEEAAAAAAANPPRLPDLDRTDLPFVTIDPAGVDGPRPGAAPRARRRRLRACTTRSPTSRRSSRPATRSTSRRTGAARRCTAPTSKVPLHPTVLSEGAASLLPDQVRPALLWTINVDDDGEGTDVEVERARVRSTGPARLRERPAGDRRRHRRREPDAAQGGRRAPARRGRPRAAGSRCRCPSRRSTSRATSGRWSSATLLPVGELERADLAAHRLRRGVADGLRAGRAAAHPAAAGPARRAAAAPHRPRARHRVAGRASSTPTSSAALDPGEAARTRR